MTGSRDAKHAPPGRNHTIDVAKGLVILLVVFAHNPLFLSGEEELRRIIFSFPLSLFFIVSGFFLKPDVPVGAFVRTRAAALLKPFFVVLLALFAFKAVKKTMLQGGLEAADYRHLAGIFYGTGPTIDWAPLWYLPSLFLTLLFAVLLLKVVRSRAWIAVLAMVLLLVGVQAIHHFWNRGICVDAGGPAQGMLPGLPWSFDLIPITSSFVLVGYLLGEKARSFQFNGLWFAVALAVFVASHAFFDATIDLNCRIYDHLVLSTIEAYAGSYLVLAVSSLIARFQACRVAVAYIGSGTIFILLFHLYIQHLAVQIFSRYLQNDVAAAILGYLAGCLLPLVIYEIAKRNSLLGMLLLPGGSDHGSKRRTPRSLGSERS